MKMKTWFDKDAQLRSFSPADTALVLLPITGSALQAHYSGAYEIKGKLNDRDYVVNTPYRRRRSRLCHINMLKPYLRRDGVPLSSPQKSAETVLSLSSADSNNAHLLLTSAVSTDAQLLDENDVTSLSTAVVQGRLKIQRCCPSLNIVFLIWMSQNVRMWSN